MKFHACVFSLHCWKMWWKYAAPMRIHVGSKYYNIPVLTHIANKRTSKIWDIEAFLHPKTESDD